MEEIPDRSSSEPSPHWVSHISLLRVPKPKAKSNVDLAPFRSAFWPCWPSSASTNTGLPRSSSTRRLSSKTGLFAVPQAFPPTTPGTRPMRKTGIPCARVQIPAFWTFTLLSTSRAGSTPITRSTFWAAAGPSVLPSAEPSQSSTIQVANSGSSPSLRNHPKTDGRMCSESSRSDPVSF